MALILGAGADRHSELDERGPVSDCTLPVATRRRKPWFWLAVMLLIFYPGEVAGQGTSSATVTLTLSAVNEFSVAGSPSLIVDTASPGAEPGEATVTGPTYNISTNETSKKITGSINSAMPANVTLKINLAAPTGGSSAGDVTLSTTAADLVTGISQVAQGSLAITLKLSATVAAGVVAPGSRTVTLTIL